MGSSSLSHWLVSAKSVVTAWLSRQCVFPLPLAVTLGQILVFAFIAFVPKVFNSRITDNTQAMQYRY